MPDTVIAAVAVDAAKSVRSFIVISSQGIFFRIQFIRFPPPDGESWSVRLNSACGLTRSDASQKISILIIVVSDLDIFAIHFDHTPLQLTEVNIDGQIRFVQNGHFGERSQSKAATTYQKEKTKSDERDERNKHGPVHAPQGQNRDASDHRLP